MRGDPRRIRRILDTLWSIDSRKISKFDAIGCQILRLKCTKFDFRCGFSPDPAGGAYSAPPDPLAVFKGLLLSGGREKREGKGRRKGRGVRRRKGRGGSRSPKYFGLEPSLLSRCEYK